MEHVSITYRNYFRVRYACKWLLNETSAKETQSNHAVWREKRLQNRHGWYSYMQKGPNLVPGNRTPTHYLSCQLHILPDFRGRNRNAIPVAAGRKYFSTAFGIVPSRAQQIIWRWRAKFQRHWYQLVAHSNLTTVLVTQT
jgi:hypothetical protein